MVTERREAMELMWRSLSCSVSRNCARVLRALSQQVMRKRKASRAAQSRAAVEAAAAEAAAA
eukprot:scaffold106496_cov54-Phaeocystis_antarctica.AAC.1